jgi:alkylated DNA nucleotide flippase Atl1
LLPEDDQDALLTELAACLGRTSARFIGRILHASGQQRWLSWVVVADDTLLHVVARDISSEREAALDLAKANERLREQIAERERVEAALQQMQRLEAVGQLTAGVAHDFNNLLTVILTGASFLQRELDNGRLDKAGKRLQNIREAGERGAKLTAQLLAFSRKQRLEPVPLNLNRPWPAWKSCCAHPGRQRLGTPGAGPAVAGADRPDPDRDDHPQPGDQRPRCHARRRPADPGHPQHPYQRPAANRKTRTR